MGRMREGRNGNRPSAKVAGTEPREDSGAVGPTRSRPRPTGLLGAAAERGQPFTGPEIPGETRKKCYLRRTKRNSGVIESITPVMRSCPLPEPPEQTAEPAVHTQRGGGPCDPVASAPRTGGCGAADRSPSALSHSQGLLCARPVGATVSLPKVIPVCTVGCVATQNLEGRALKVFLGGLKIWKETWILPLPLHPSRRQQLEERVDETQEVLKFND